MTLKIGASSFIWVSPFSNETLHLAEKVRTMGFDSVEDPQKIDIERTREALDRFNLGATICGAFGPSGDASSEDPAIRGQAADYIKACVNIAKGIGSPVQSLSTWL
jgi:D-psicose/D-tagatose/L-ribulose 3-epimerase